LVPVRVNIVDSVMYRWLVLAGEVGCQRAARTIWWYSITTVGRIPLEGRKRAVDILWQRQGVERREIRMGELRGG
jgi:hypothetical protein